MGEIQKFKKVYTNIADAIDEYVRTHRSFAMKELKVSLEHTCDSMPSQSTIDRSLKSLRHKYGVKRSSMLFESMNKVVKENAANSDIDTFVAGFYSNPFLTVIATEPYEADKVLRALTEDVRDTISPDTWCFKINNSHILVVSPSSEHQQRIQMHLQSRKKQDLSALSADQKKSGANNDTAQK